MKLIIRKVKKILAIGFYLVIGEGERTFIELCDVIDSKKFYLLPKVHGIAYRENGKIRITHSSSLIENLDQLPFLDRVLVENRSPYNNTDLILTSRGCPYNCILS